MTSVTPEPTPLPLVEKNSPKDLSIYRAKICAIIKAQAVKVVRGQHTDFDKEIADSIESIWQDGFSNGLKARDRFVNYD